MDSLAQPTVTIDDREEAGGAVERRLATRGAKLCRQRLAAADFLASSRAAIERKTDADLEASIVDGRLFRQAAELAEAFASPVIGVVGKKFQRLHPRALEGAVVSLLVDYRIPVMFFETEEKLADFVYAVAYREQLGERRQASLLTRKKPASLPQGQQLVLEGLPEIGPATAKTLLNHFGTVENVFTADEDELQEVAGVGETTARKIRQLVSAQYLPQA